MVSIEVVLKSYHTRTVSVSVVSVEVVLKSYQTRAVSVSVVSVEVRQTRTVSRCICGLCWSRIRQMWSPLKSYQTHTVSASVVSAKAGWDKYVLSVYLLSLLRAGSDKHMRLAHLWSLLKLYYCQTTPQARASVVFAKVVLLSDNTLSQCICGLC